MSELKNITDAARELNTTRQSVYSWLDGIKLNFQIVSGTKYVVVDEKYNKIKEERRIK